MDDFIRRFDALPDDEKQKIYTRIGQATAQIPLGSVAAAYLVAAVKTAEECMRGLEGVQHGR